MAARRYNAEKAANVLFKLLVDGDIIDYKRSEANDGDAEEDPVSDSDYNNNNNNGHL